MEEKTTGRRGVPKGNQNTRKHDFYSKVLDETERLDIELAIGVDGIDDEIALLRVKIKSVLALLVMSGVSNHPVGQRGTPAIPGEPCRKEKRGFLGPSLSAFSVKQLQLQYS